MQILVTNNRAGLIQVSRGHGNPPINLTPGVNSVDLATWQDVRDLDGVKRMASTKVEIVRGRPIDPETVGKMQLVEGKTLPDESGLSGLKPAACEKVLADTLDPRLLARWEAEEKRPDVKRMIAARAAAIAPPKSGKD